MRTSISIEIIAIHLVRVLKKGVLPFREQNARIDRDLDFVSLYYSTIGTDIVL